MSEKCDADYEELSERIASLERWRDLANESLDRITAPAPAPPAEERCCHVIRPEHCVLPGGHGGKCVHRPAPASVPAGVRCAFPECADPTSEGLRYGYAVHCDQSESVGQHVEHSTWVKDAHPFTPPSAPPAFKSDDDEYEPVPEWMQANVEQPQTANSPHKVRHLRRSGCTTPPACVPEASEQFDCPSCGPHVKADEDGCCVHCGRDTKIAPRRPEGEASESRWVTIDFYQRAIADREAVERVEELEAAWSGVPSKVHQRFGKSLKRALRGERAEKEKA